MNQRQAPKKARYILIFSVLLAILGKPTLAFSGEDDLTGFSLLKFSAGILSGILIHEGSHALVAGLTNTHMSWEVGTYNQPMGFTERADTKAEGVAVYSAGFLSQAIGGEIILQTDRIDKNDAFVRGMMAWNILNPLLYTLDYWVIRRSNKENGRNYQGDLEGIEHYSSERTAHAFAVSMSAIALFQGYRFLQTQTWAPDWMKSKGNNFILSPAPSGGFILTYHYRF